MGIPIGESVTKIARPKKPNSTHKKKKSAINIGGEQILEGKNALHQIILLSIFI
jgi:hypothetical protein